VDHAEVDFLIGGVDCRDDVFCGGGHELHEAGVVGVLEAWVVDYVGLGDDLATCGWEAGGEDLKLVVVVDGVEARETVRKAESAVFHIIPV